VPGFLELARTEQAEGGDPDARDVLHELLHSDKETVRLRAAVALLTRPGESDDDQPTIPGGAIQPVDGVRSVFAHTCCRSAGGRALAVVGLSGLRPAAGCCGDGE